MEKKRGGVGLLVISVFCAVCSAAGGSIRARPLTVSKRRPVLECEETCRVECSRKWFYLQACVDVDWGCLTGCSHGCHEKGMLESCRKVCSESFAQRCDVLGCYQGCLMSTSKEFKDEAKVETTTSLPVIEEPTSTSLPMDEGHTHEEPTSTSPPVNEDPAHGDSSGTSPPIDEDQGISTQAPEDEYLSRRQRRARSSVRL